MKPSHPVPTAAFLLVATAVPASSGQDYAAVILGSHHVGNEKLENTTPGLTFGHRWPASETRLPAPAAIPGLEYHVEGGVFRNSYGEISPILLAGASMAAIYTAWGELRIGASTGTAYYRELSASLEDDYGIPNIGGFIPMAAATVALRHGPAEIRLTTVPSGKDTGAIFNFSAAFAF